MNPLLSVGTASALTFTGGATAGITSGSTALVNTTAQAFFSQAGLMAKSVATLSTWQFALLTGGAVLAAALVVGAIVVFIIRMINSRDIYYSASGGKYEGEEKKEDSHSQAGSSQSAQVEYDNYPYYEGDPIATSRTRDLYNPKSELPPPLKLREPSDNIKLLQLKLFFNTPEKPVVEKQNQAPPKLVHLTLDRPKPPGRLTHIRK